METEKALLIAEKEGWEQHHRNTAYWYKDDYNRDRNIKLKEEVVDSFSSFNGLMEIVENKILPKCNIGLSRTELTIIRKDYTVEIFQCDLTKDYTLIDALQDAILEYYKLLEQENHEQN